MTLKLDKYLFKTITILLALVFSLLSIEVVAENKEVKESQLSTEEAVNKLQSNYDKIKSYSAEFEQTYTSVTYPIKNTLNGKVYFKTPGKMRWDYKEPQPKHFIYDAKTLYLYRPNDNEVQIYENLKQNNSDLASALSFLWGEGKLIKNFEAKLITKNHIWKNCTDPILELKPKKPLSNISKIYFRLDSKSFMVNQTAMVDSVGNINILKFKSVDTNSLLDDKIFVFKVPEGVHVVKGLGK